MSARALGAGILFVSAIFVVSGCDHFDGGRTTETDDVRPIVDEQRGRYGDVRLGSSEADVRAAFGEPGGGDGFFPLEAESYRGPVSIASPGGRQPILLRYERVAFLVAPGRGVFALSVTDPEATTARGVRVGDPLDLVRENYEHVRCGKAVAGEAVSGGDPPTYAWCRMRLDSVEVFFGDDPIESVTLTQAAS
jgi:hypothetical protein